eukprot:sb/3479326/
MNAAIPYANEKNEKALDDVQMSDKDLKFGRTWEKSDLEVLKSPVLHSLCAVINWFVLLKERNRCLTTDAYCRQNLQESSFVHEKLQSVQQSMENLQAVYTVEEREEHVDEAKTVLWLRRVGNLVYPRLGEEYARELSGLYTQYTRPHSDREHEGMKKLKHHQIFTKEFNRVRQPYDAWEMQMEMPEEESVWEARKRNYDSEDYVNEDDFVPGLEGFLHNIKREDREKLSVDPPRMKESRERREARRIKIISRIYKGRVADDTAAELKNLQRWRNRVEGTENKPGE